MLHKILKNYTNVEKVLEASHLYRVQKVFKQMKAALLTFVQQEPLLVYTIACRFGLEQEAGEAAKVWMQSPLYLMVLDQAERSWQ